MLQKFILVGYLVIPLPHNAVCTAVYGRPSVYIGSAGHPGLYGRTSCKALIFPNRNTQHEDSRVALTPMWKTEHGTIANTGPKPLVGMKGDRPRRACQLSAYVIRSISVLQRVTQRLPSALWVFIRDTVSG